MHVVLEQPAMLIATSNNKMGKPVIPWSGLRLDLVAACRHYGVTVQEDWLHNAGNDARLTMDLLVAMMSRGLTLGR